jgi:hypothetical protein
MQTVSTIGLDIAKSVFQVHGVGECGSVDHASAGIAQFLILAQTRPMKHRGIRYTIRARIEREQWYVAIHPAGVEMAGKVIAGPRESAALQAHSMINRWLEKQPHAKTLKPHQNAT